jgi:hypothetical protein
MKQVASFHDGFLLGLYFDPEDGGDMFLENIGSLSVEYTALYSRRQNSSKTKQRERHGRQNPHE